MKSGFGGFESLRIPRNPSESLRPGHPETADLFRNVVLDRFGGGKVCFGADDVALVAKRDPASEQSAGLLWVELQGLVIGGAAAFNPGRSIPARAAR
jgi:hypothetical protein